jgi:hypothetical protein
MESGIDRLPRRRFIPSLVIISGAVLLGLSALPSAQSVLDMAAQAKKTTATTSSTTATKSMTTSSTTATGNGAPSGYHYTLNIHGVAKGGSESLTTNGGDIFVPLQGKCNIALSPGAFAVLDANCLDGNAAFQLPNPVSGGITSTTGAVTTTYSVYVRALAKPGGSASITTCATDPLTLELVCSLNAFVAVETRSSGKSVFTNVSGDLLFVTTCVNGTVTRVPLFSTTLQNYFWSYDNTGLRLAQLRFYQVPTTLAATSSLTC